MDPECTSELADFYSENIHFIDPINEGRGLDDLQAIYQDLFKKLKNISIDVTDSRGDEQECFLRWVMRYQFRNKHRELPGASYFTFSKDGKVASQHDYWDASIGVYSEFPGLGLAIRRIKKLVQVRP